MKNKIRFYLLLLIGFFCIKCKENSQITYSHSKQKNEIKYATGLSLRNYNGYSVMTINNPWPNSNKEFTYILKEEKGIIPDSLKSLPIVNIPVKKIVVTSTTHIPSLEMLGVENTLIGFPKLDYISSEKIRSLIESKKIVELGSNKALNTEVLLDIQPDVFIGFGIDNNNTTLENLQKNGIKVLLNGDWNEESPLGKAEWIKFFGALYGKQKKATEIFKNIEKDYLKMVELSKKATSMPKVMAGAMYEDKWYLPQGKSWGAIILKDAKANYLWKESPGTGSLSLSFETVLEEAKNADIWIGPGQFTSLKEMSDSNSHYKQFKAFQNNKVYSFSTKKGKTGGVLFYELAPNRPDLVIKDLIKISHPELLPNHNLFFYEQLQ